MQTVEEKLAKSLTAESIELIPRIHYRPVWHSLAVRPGSRSKRTVAVPGVRTNHEQKLNNKKSSNVSAKETVESGKTGYIYDT
jgi:hypothetical protein